MNIHGIHHASVIVEDLERARSFYEGILGLNMNPKRPGKSFEGIWYDLGNQQIHLIKTSVRDFGDESNLYPGARRHVALIVEGFEDIEIKLKAAGLPIFPSSSGRKVLFCRDFDGNAFELIHQSEFLTPSTTDSDGSDRHLV